MRVRLCALGEEAHTGLARGVRLCTHAVSVCSLHASPLAMCEGHAGASGTQTMGAWADCNEVVVNEGRLGPDPPGPAPPPEKPYMLPASSLKRALGLPAASAVPPCAAFFLSPSLPPPSRPQAGHGTGFMNTSAQVGCWVEPQGWSRPPSHLRFGRLGELLCALRCCIPFLKQDLNG